MSLLNDMLRDLEKRAPQSAPAPVHAYAVQRQGSARAKRWWVLAGAGAFVLLVAGIMLTELPSRVAGLVSSDGAAAVETGSAPATKTSVKQISPDPELPPTPVADSSFAAESPSPVVDSSTEAKSPIPVAAARSDAKLPSTRAEPPPVESQAITAVEPATPDSTSEVVERVRRTPSFVELDEQKRHAVLALAARGDHAAALDMAQQFVGRHADARHTRAGLARLLMLQGRVTEAEGILMQGLALAPLDPELRKLQARLLMSRQEWRAALRLLQHDAPALPRDTEYHALLAALQQRLGAHRDSVMIYQQLLRHDQHQASWQAGLAMSLDALGESVQARLVYRQALQAAGLDQALREHIQQRLAELQ